MTWTARHMTVAAALAVAWAAAPAPAVDVSPPPILQWFESSYSTIERRTPDMFMAGFGSVWLPPPGRADLSDFSVGYDVYDRFDLGSPRHPTLYGTETGLKSVADILHRAAADLHIDTIINHNGFSDQGTSGFLASGGYPGFLLQNPDGGSDPFGVPGTDGDFNSAFDFGDIRGRLAGLIDINHGSNFRFIRSPVPGFGPVPGDHGGNLPAGDTPDGGGRLANVPDENNRRFYPDRDLQPIYVFDPTTGEENIPIYPFNTADPMAGDPVGENVTGYLMRYLQWMVQDIGVDGFRLDAAKHVEGFAFNYFDRAVYRQNPRLNLDGSVKQVFSYSEVFDGNKAYLQTFVRKDINPAEPGRIGGNRDVLDFPLYFALRDNLTGNGFENSWFNVRDATIDTQDDGLHNGSQGVMFVQSHDDEGPFLTSVAHAYMLMHPGNAVVYFNGKEFGDQRDFPKDGRGDALGGVYGNRITSLVDIRNTHGRGDYAERWIEKELFAFERVSSAVTLLSNRLDAGFDSRTLFVSFAPGTPLIELTGNAADPFVDPFNDLPEVVMVNADQTINVRFPRNTAANGNFHGRGFLIYGLSGPQAPAGLELSGVDSVIPGGNPAPTPYENGTTRLTDLNVIKGDSFGVRLQTVDVNLLGSIRDIWADGDNALLKLDGGVDVNGNGHVDFVTPASVIEGFESFGDKASPLIGPGGIGGPRGDGEFLQTVDATGLAEGVHFLEARAFRHRTDNGPAIYSSFKQVIYVDRLPPDSAVASFEPFDPAAQQNRDLTVRSLDKTADTVHVFLNLPAAMSDAAILNLAQSGQGQAQQIDRDLFVYGFFDVPHGNNVATLVSFEITGTSNVQRVPGLFTDTIIGRGLGDLNFDGAFSPIDLANVPGAFEEVLYSQNTQFNPAADVNADGLVDNRDLFMLEGELVTGGADTATMQTYRDVVVRRGDVNADGATNALDIDTLYAQFGGNGWLPDLTSDGTVNGDDVNTLVGTILRTVFGDLNVDGTVDFADVAMMAPNYGTAGGKTWAQGDLDGDDAVGPGDFTLLAGNFGFSALNPGAPVGVPVADLAAALGFQLPEPGTAAMLLAGALWIGLGRTRRKRRVHGCSAPACCVSGGAPRSSAKTWPSSNTL